MVTKIASISLVALALSGCDVFGARAEREACDQYWEIMLTSVVAEHRATSLANSDQAWRDFETAGLERAAAEALVLSRTGVEREVCLTRWEGRTMPNMFGGGTTVYRAPTD